MSLRGTNREVGEIAVIDFSGAITLGDGTATLRRMVRELVQKGHHKILLNLGEVDYIDSAGLGELVSAHATVRKASGDLKLVQPKERVRDLIQITRLHTVFDVQPNEAAAVSKFQDGRPG
jgi:anti-sigma B factor antagonist